MPDTHYIARKAATSILHSARTAKQVWNRPLNYSVTINFWQFGSDQDTIFRDFADLREKWFSRWSRNKLKNGIRSKNGVPTYAYAHEATKDLPHTHWLLHLKPENVDDFKNKLIRWLLKRFDMKSLPDGAVHFQTVHNAEGAKLYLTKGIDPHFGQMWRIRVQDTGRIANRRADTSRNLGPKYWQENKARYRAAKRQKRAA